MADDDGPGRPPISDGHSEERREAGEEIRGEEARPAAMPPPGVDPRELQSVLNELAECRALLDAALSERS